MTVQKDQFQVQKTRIDNRQKSNYSGKKKRHTRKHLAVVDEKKRVLILSKAREGRVHDKRAHDEDDIVGSIPEEIPVEADSGFFGLRDRNTKTSIYLIKNPKVEISTKFKKKKTVF